jgi:5-methyltetrahydrofolate--homocysteine methyltransferase
MVRLHDFDWDAHARTWSAFWAHDLERPLVLANTWEPWNGPAWWCNQLGGVPPTVGADEIAAAAADQLERQVWHGDAFPKYWVNFGPGVMAAFLGGDLHADGSTTWFTPGRHAGMAMADLRLPDLTGRWFDRVQAVTRACVERFGRRACVGITDIGGGLDVVASLRESEQLLFDCMDQPEELDRLAREVTGRWWECYQAQTALLEPAGRGTTPWAPIWSPRHCYMLQCDFAYMIGPHHFARWVVPDLADLCGRLDHGFYHLDGKGQLPHLDLLLDIRDLRGVQWIPGTGNADAADPVWWPVLSRIRAAGKLVQIFVSGSKALAMARELPTAGYVLAIGNDVPGSSTADLVAAIQREAEATRRRLRPQVAVAGTVAPPS